MDRVANRRINKLHALKLIIIARIELAFVIEHKTFELTSSNRYWLTRFRFPKSAAFYYNNLVSFEVAPLSAVSIFEQHSVAVPSCPLVAFLFFRRHFSLLFLDLLNGFY